MLSEKTVEETVEKIKTYLADFQTKKIKISLIVSGTVGLTCFQIKTFECHNTFALEKG